MGVGAGNLPFDCAQGRAKLDFWAENKGLGPQEWTRGEIGLSLKNGVKCFCNKGLRW